MGATGGGGTGLLGGLVGRGSGASVGRGCGWVWEVGVTGASDWTRCSTRASAITAVGATVGARVGAAGRLTAGAVVGGAGGGLFAGARATTGSEGDGSTVAGVDVRVACSAAKAMPPLRTTASTVGSGVGCGGGVRSFVVEGGWPAQAVAATSRQARAHTRPTMPGLARDGTGWWPWDDCMARELSADGMLPCLSPPARCPCYA